jgi:IS605 OrfB family transposase
MISAKLKLKTEPEQFEALRAVSLAYRDGLNAVSRYAYAHGKTSSNQRLHQGMYAQLRRHYQLPSQLACSVERQVAATYKSLWTKVKKKGKGTEPVSKKARQANRVYSQWSFAELQALIAYKAALAGSMAIKVDANYTSDDPMATG